MQLGIPSGQHHVVVHNAGLVDVVSIILQFDCILDHVNQTHAMVQIFGVEHVVRGRVDEGTDVYFESIGQSYYIFFHII